MTHLVETAPATDEEITQYAEECANANPDRCSACFAGPALADCTSFLCRRDVGKLLARLSELRAERDALQAELAAARAELHARR